MFASRGIYGNRLRRGNRPTAFRTFFGSVYTRQKQPILLRAICISVSMVLMIGGGVLTWIGFRILSGSSGVATAMFGLILLVIAFLTFIVSMGHIMKERKNSLQCSHGIEQLASGATCIAAGVIDSEEVTAALSGMIDGYKTPDIYGQNEMMPSPRTEDLEMETSVCKSINSRTPIEYKMSVQATDIPSAII